MPAPSPSRFFEHFFTSEAAFKAAFQRRARQGAFRGSGPRAARAWRERSRRRFAALLGMQHFRKAPARARKLDAVELDGLRREEWLLQTEAHVWMPYYLFIPRFGKPGPRPLVLCPHGHASGGKWATGGRTDIPEMRGKITQYHYDYGVQIAREGFLTACPDARGFGARREPALQGDRANPERLYSNSCHNLMLSGAPLGLTVQGMWAWDLRRLLDHLTRDPRVDASRVGCAGLSGGGLQTLNLAALDLRIKAAVVSGYFYGVRESLQVLNSNCDCNLVPRLWEHFDMGDLGALAAPRGLFIETGARDPLNGPGLRNVTRQVAITRKVYQAFGVPENLHHHIFHGEHRWDGTRAIPWLKEKLSGA